MQLQRARRHRQPAAWEMANTPAAKLRRLHAQLIGLLGTVQEADAAPTPALVKAAEASLGSAEEKVRSTK